MKSFATIEQRQQLRQLQKLVKKKEANGLKFYRPHLKQDQFHKAGGFRWRYARTGNRFGKSEMGAAEDVSWCIGERPFYAEGSDERFAGIPSRPVTGLIIVQDWGKVDEIFTSSEPGQAKGKIWKFLPTKNFISVARNHSGSVERVIIKSRWGGHSVLRFETVKSFVQNPMGQESGSFDFIHVDEPCPEEMWKANSRGLIDAGGKAWFTCTPLIYLWINDMFFPDRRIADQSAEKAIVNGKKWAITGSPYDNPHLSPDDIQEFEDQLTDDEKECRIHGIPLALSGLVYKEFDPSRHIYYDTPIGWKNPIDPPKNYSVVVSIDPHPSTPHAVLFAATAPSGEVFFYREIFRKCLIRDLCNEIKGITHGRFVVQTMCDPLAYIDNPIDGTRMADEFYRNGVRVVKAVKDLDRGILVGREMLTSRKVYFHNGLRETLHEFQNYVWDPEKPKPVDKRDHMMECYYRMALHGLKFVDKDDTHESLEFEEVYDELPRPVDLDFFEEERRGRSLRDRIIHARRYPSE